MIRTLDTLRPRDALTIRTDAEGFALPQDADPLRTVMRRNAATLAARAVDADRRARAARTTRVIPLGAACGGHPRR